MQNAQTRKLAIIGTLIAGAIVVPLVIQVTLSMLSLSRNRPIPVPSSNPLTVSNESDWQKYTNEEQGFSISYPPELYPAENPFEGYSATFLISDLKEFEIPAEISPRVQVFAIDTPVSEFVDEMNDGRNIEQFPEFEEIELNGKSAYQTKALDPEVIFTHTIVGNGEKSYLIELFTIEKENDALKEIYEIMVSSFEIIE